MAIVKMNKFTLLGFESKKSQLLKRLQCFSEVEFINLQKDELLENNETFQGLIKDSVDSKYLECEEKLSKAKFVLEFLKDYLPQKSGLKAMKEGKAELTLSELEEKVKNSNWEAIYDKVKEKEREISALDNEITKLEGKIETLEPWKNLDVSFEELNSVKIPHFLGTVPKQYEETLVSQLENCYLEIIGSTNQDLFFLCICNEEDKEEVVEKLKEFGFSKFKTDEKDKPMKIIHDSRENIEQIKSKRFFVLEELASFEEDNKTMELVYEYYQDLVIRKNASNNFLKTKNVMLIQGWIPAEENSKLEKIVKDVLGNDFYLTFEEVKEDEISEVPVKLKNNEINTAFESITQMYSTPKYDEIDPTPYVTPFFLLFFGMMVADIGYGLLQLIATAVALKYFNFEEDTRRFVKFFFYLSFPIIGFGMIYGSFFGGIIDLPKLIDPTNDVTVVLLASVALGAVQIFFGLGIKAAMLIKAGKPKDAFYDVGSWVITLISVAVVIGKALGFLNIPNIAYKIALGFMIFGMAVIVLTNGRQEKSKVAQLGQGAYALYGITSYVGDLVSYTRLMALGLAGGSLASAFNLMMNMIPGVAFIFFAPLIFVFGHIFNLALSLLGAYVHTCRLQYVEYFGKFYEGGGKAFAPLKTENKYINVKKE